MSGSCLANRTDGDEESAIDDPVFVYIGILMGIIGSVMINLGNNMQALGMQRSAVIRAKSRWRQAGDQTLAQRATSLASVAEAASKEANRAPVDDATKAALGKWSRIKVIGTVVFVTGSLINFAAFALAAASVLAPLEAVQFITNLIFGKLVHGHKITRKMKIASVFTAVGTCVAVGFGPMTVYTFDLDDLRCFWRDSIWIGYEVVVLSLAAALLLWWHFANKALEAERPWKHSLTLLPVVYAVSSALVGTQSVVQAKCLSEIVSLLFEGEPAHEAWFTWFAVVLFLVTVGFWLYRLNDALGKYDTLFIIPLLQASYIVLATLAGGIYFQEFSTLEWWQYVAFSSGIAIMFVGLCGLIPPNPEQTYEQFKPKQVVRDILAPPAPLLGSTSRPGSRPGSAQKFDLTAKGAAAAAAGGGGGDASSRRSRRPSREVPLHLQTGPPPPQHQAGVASAVVVPVANGVAHADGAAAHGAEHHHGDAVVALPGRCRVQPGGELAEFRPDAQFTPDALRASGSGTWTPGNSRRGSDAQVSGRSRRDSRRRPSFGMVAIDTTLTDALNAGLPADGSHVRVDPAGDEPEQDRLALSGSLSPSSFKPPPIDDSITEFEAC